MKNTASKKRVIDFNADLQVWMRENAEDNSEQLSRLKRNLRQARELELTPGSGRCWPCTLTRTCP